MDSIITAPARCKVRAVIRFLHAEGQSAAEIHRPLCRVYGDKFTSEPLNKVRRSIQNKRRGMLTKDVVLLHDKARPHTAARTNALTLRRLMSYIYMEHPFLMFLDHTQRRSTVDRTPLDE